MSEQPPAPKPTAASIAAAKEAEKTAQALKRIQRAFATFDQQNNGTCDVREVGTIIRSLNIYPTQEQLHAWIKQMEEDEPTGYVTFQKLSAVLLKIILSNNYVRDDEEKLFRAFQTLDAEKRGYLLPEELKTLLTTQGEVFSNEEIDEMLTACTDPTENKIYYEDYVTILAQ